MSQCCAFHPQVWLTQPLVDLTAITQRHDTVEAFVTDNELRERLRDHSLQGGSAHPEI